MIGAQQFADRRMHARLPPANGFDLGPRALHLVHVGGGTADVADHAFEIGSSAIVADFGHDRFLAARLNDAALVGRDRTERAAAEAAAHDRDRVLDHLEGGDRFACSSGAAGACRAGRRCGPSPCRKSATAADCTTTAWRSCHCTSRRALYGFVSLWIIRVASAKAALSRATCFDSWAASSASSGGVSDAPMA